MSKRPWTAPAFEALSYFLQSTHLKRVLDNGQAGGLPKLDLHAAISHMDQNPTAQLTAASCLMLICQAEILQQTAAPGSVRSCYRRQALSNGTVKLVAEAISRAVNVSFYTCLHVRQRIVQLCRLHCSFDRL